MKRILSLVLVLALVLGTIPAGFAATATAGETLKGYGLIAGDQNGNLNENKEITRAEMMVVLAQLLGKSAEAKAYSIPSTSKDVKAGAWYAPYVAFAEKEAWTAGKGNGMFDPNGKVTVQETAAFMMKALGFVVTDFSKVVEEATAKGLLKDVSGMATAPILRASLFTAALNTLNTPAKDSTVKLGDKLGVMKPMAGALAVDTVVANTAKSFEVKFKNIVADTTKVGFEVKRDATVAAVTVSWNENKTVATLTAASKVAEGNYEVVVSDKTAEKPVVLNTTKIVIKKEEVTKIVMDNDSVMRISDFEGVVGYKVYNQYNEDITDSSLSRSLQVRTSTDQGSGTAGTMTPDYKTATLNIQHGTQKLVDSGSFNVLRELKTVVITFSEPTTGFVFTKTLTVSDSINAVSEIKINGMLNEKGEKVDFVYSQTKTYYLDVTVLDAKGKEVKNKKVLESKGPGLQNILRFNASNSIGVTVVDSPIKSGTAAFRIDLANISKPSYDTPVTFTAIAPFATSGKNNSVFTTTLKRAAKVESFKMFAPVETVSKGKTVEIPFEAYDQNGVIMKDFSDINGVVLPSGSDAADKFAFIKQSNGTAKLFATLNTEKLYYLSATVQNSLLANYNQISIDVKANIQATKIEALRHPALYTPNATWGTKRVSDITIKDQYDRAINMRTDNQTAKYYVVVETGDASVVGLEATNTAKSVTIMGDTGLTFKGGSKAGVTQITYTLYQQGVATAIDYASTNVSNVELKDITKIEVKPEAKKILMLEEDAAFLNLTTRAITNLTRDSETLHNELDVYGLNTAGDHIALSEEGVNKVWYSSSNVNFTEHPDYVGEFLATGNFADNINSESTVITAYYQGENGILTATATVEAVREKPIATETYFGYNREALRTGAINVTTNLVEVTAADFANLFEGRSILYYQPNGDMFGGFDAPKYAAVRIGASSKFGEHYMNNVLVSKVTTTGSSNRVIAVNAATGVITSSGNAFATNDEFVITAITSNGKTAEFRLKIVAGTTTSQTNVIDQIKTMMDSGMIASSLTETMLRDGGMTYTSGNLVTYKQDIIAAGAAVVSPALKSTAVDTLAKINVILAASNAKVSAIQAAAPAATDLVTSLAAIGVTAKTANVAAYKTAFAAAAVADANTTLELANIVALVDAKADLTNASVTATTDATDATKLVITAPTVAGITFALSTTSILKATPTTTVTVTMTKGTSTLTVNYTVATAAGVTTVTKN